MEQPKTDAGLMAQRPPLSAELDANALNNAGWAFIDAWNSHTDQAMSGRTWNNLKPMVAAAIRKYLEDVSNDQAKGPARSDGPA